MTKKNNQNIEEKGLRLYFENKLDELEKRDKKDYESLMGMLMYWGSCIPFRGILYDAIKSQIEFQAEKKQVTPKEFVDCLFSQKNYDMWMFAFQA